MKWGIKWLGPPRRWIPGFLLALILFGVLGLLGAGYYYVEHNPNFCVTCHTMEEPFQRWKQGSHAMVNCHDCHKQSKIESLHQVWMYLTQRPDQVVHHPHLDHAICAQCHMTQKQHWHDIRETAGHKVHFERGGIECLDCHGLGIHDIARPEGVCVNCHTDKADMHNRMAFMQCTQCHRFLAKGELKPTAEVCKSCHDKIKRTGEHPPVSAETDCLICHRPHQM
ncbi:MAG: hypothetical protein HY466_01475 [Deltaproteobacteria bacterium]|nr:hypothetical protein [Deltaproteobacteria bacterium]